MVFLLSYKCIQVYKDEIRRKGYKYDDKHVFTNGKRKKRRGFFQHTGCICLSKIEVLILFICLCHDQQI
jgi:hypothetical protein